MYLRILAAFLLPSYFVLVPLSAQTKSAVTIGVGSPAGVYAVNQPIVLHAGVEPVTGSIVPTGSVQFFANGSPLGTLVQLSRSSADTSIPVSAPGLYNLTASYSGDSNYAPALSTYSMPVTVEENPPTLVIHVSEPSLTFNSGATSGNTNLFTEVPVNGFHGSYEIHCLIPPDPAKKTLTNGPACDLSPGTAPDGSAATIVTIWSSPPYTAQQTRPSEHDTTWQREALFCSPLFLLLIRVRRRHRLYLLAALLASLPMALSLSGCAGQPPPPPSITVSSAGQYTVNITGKAYDQSTGAVTLQNASFALTIN